MTSQDTLFVCWLCCRPFEPPRTHFCHQECDRRLKIHRDYCNNCKSHQLATWTKESQKESSHEGENRS